MQYIKLIKKGRRKEGRWGEKHGEMREGEGGRGKGEGKGEKLPLALLFMSP